MNKAVTTVAAGLERVRSDERLARRAAAGDERAFAVIFDRYHQRLYRYCLAIVGDSQDAQDALQNTMVKVLRALPGEERRIDLKPWLYRIAHNESIELLRRRRETRELDAEQAAPGSGLAAEAASRERLRRLLSDLDELPERQRGALIMRELAGLEFDEIGTALGTSPAVARQTLYEARLSLRQMDEGREMSCAVVTEALSAGDGRVSRRRDLRAHLRTCSSCRRFGEEIESRQRDLVALAPLPALAGASVLQGVLGAGGGAGGGGLVAALGGGAAKSAGVSVAVKGAATVAAVAAIGVGAADRGGLIDAGLPGGGGSPATQVERPAGTDSGGSPTDPGSAGPAAAAAGDGGGGVQAGAAALESSRAAKHGVARGGGAKAAKPVAGATSPAPLPTPTAANAAAHPRGKGHEKQLPSASAHGQQTAAEHRNAQHGSAAGKSLPGKPSHATKAAHPAKPPKPAKAPIEPAPPRSPPRGAPEAKPNGNNASQPPAAAAPAHPETGKKHEAAAG